ncbi:hypothetical protein CDAR_164161 [Caerostris darwini]|uniref:Uncharacterized protein n=1 Tax=Caerostris darwini TaxID=1538125 RepID=A0AAV4X875_9ARAC|nr:hypothetical protein CDAR_164161 [Caerostris darwini]
MVVVSIFDSRNCKSSISSQEIDVVRKIYIRWCYTTNALFRHINRNMYRIPRIKQVRCGERKICLGNPKALIVSSPLLGYVQSVLHPQFCPGLLYQENNSRSVSSISHATGATDRGQPCLREEVEVVSRPKDIQWTRWTRIETGNELMT